MAYVFTFTAAIQQGLIIVIHVVQYILIFLYIHHLSQQWKLNKEKCPLDTEIAPAMHFSAKQKSGAIQF